MKSKRIILLIFLMFAGVYYLGRIGIFILGISGEMQFEEEQSELVEGVVMYSFLAIGVLGILMLPGVLLHKLWGFWGTVAVSIYTIAFDVWAFLAVQSSAAAGVIPAGIILAYMALTRKDFLHASVSTA